MNFNFIVQVRQNISDLKNKISEIVVSDCVASVQCVVYTWWRGSSVSVVSSLDPSK